MNAIEIATSALNSTKDLLTMYLADLDDEDLLVRPVPGANNIAWQLGHLIGAEIDLVASQFAMVAYPELPEDFKGKHGKEAASSDDPSNFCSKKTYLELFTSVRAATIRLVEGLSENDLDKPTQGNMAGFAPKLGDYLLLVANHTLMHAGQFTVVRRKLNKPVIF